MSQVKKRTVHIFEPYRERPDGSPSDLPNKFWEGFRGIVSKLDAKNQFVTIRGTEYRGAARHCSESMVDYLYLGKSRDRADWPESSVGEDDEQPLSLDHDGRLVEPCYLLPIDGTELVALLRSTAGPHVSAVEDWMTILLKQKLHNDTIKLRPYLRTDDMERLESAVGVARMNIKIDKNSSVSKENEGRIVGPVHDIYGGLGGNATVAIEVSYEHSIPTPKVGRSMKEELKSFLRSSGLRKAEGTIITEDAYGKIKRERLDFIKDKVTFQVPVGDGPDVIQSPAVVISAMGEAIKQFRKLGVNDQSKQ